MAQESGDLLPSLALPADAGDPKYLASLSTILVATVQEIKDRVSQVEFLFCSQIFPGFQSTAKNTRQQIAAAREAVEAEWRGRESDLMRRIEVLSVEKEEVAAEVEGLRGKIGVLEEAREREKGEILRRWEGEKEEMLTKLEGLRKGGEIAVEEMREKIRVLVAGREEMEERLLKEMALKDKELMVEKSKRRRLTDGWKELNERYKHLKSQYKFLLKRTGLVTEKDGASGDLGGSPVVSHNQKSAPELENEDEDITPLGSQSTELKCESSSLENLEDKKDEGPAQNANACCSKSPSPGSSGAHLSKIPSNMIVKQIPAVDLKSCKSRWRDTRPNQVQRGLDPHDDFLDTPLELVRRNFKKTPHNEEQYVPNHAPNNMDCKTSDDQTQEINGQPTLPKLPVSPPKPPNKRFKYVEPVRKKADRDKLKGIQCNQCKKFYDAILPHENDSNGNNHKNARCEHHDGVSRHRYRYAPPMTPEGFWNIGFDSEA